MFNKKITPDTVDDWKCVYQTSIESEARLVKAFLQNENLICEILSKKDTAYNVTFGDLSALFVYVPTDQAKKAEKLIQKWKKGEITGPDSNDPDSGDNTDE